MCRPGRYSRYWVSLGPSIGVAGASGDAGAGASGDVGAGVPGEAGAGWTGVTTDAVLIVQVAAAGVALVLPAASVALTVKVWLPSARAL